jgi:ADP-heptose:LPS heptosyltransferase
MAPKPFPILFIAPSRLGDAVLCSGLVRFLAEQIPNARFTFAVSDLVSSLFSETPGLERLIRLEKRALGLHWMDLWGETRARHWGLIVDLRGSSLSGWLRRDKRAVYKAGGPHEHKVAQAARVLMLDGEPPAPFIYTSEDTETRADLLTAGEGPILAVAPAANWMGKAWPAERFAAVAREILGPSGPLAGGRVMVLGSAEDRAVAEAVKATAPRTKRIDLVGRETPLSVYAALKRARLFIGNDSGLMHLAAAAGVPTLGLFGPSDETLYAPWGRWGRTVRGPRAFADFKAADPQLNHAICHMLDLSPRAVFDAACALIAESEPEFGAAHAL